MNDDENLPPNLLRSEPDALIQPHRFAHKAMATVFEVVCVHEDRSYAGQAARAVFDLLDRLETELTCHRSSSDISRINSLKPGESASVGPWAMECLLMAKHFHRQTGGAFDVALGSGLDKVELNPADARVRVQASNVRLDLGGIGKGYAIDRAGELLEEWGISHALVHGGFSSVLALDAPPGRDGWPLTISLPAPGPAPVLLRVMARRHCWSASGIRKKDHIVDPRTGIPVRNRAAVWISGAVDALAAAFPRKDPAGVPAGIFETGGSPSAVAEALSTAFMIMSLDEIADLCRTYPGIEARILTSDPDNPSGPHLLTSFTR